ncbi:MAG: hypothetical protein LBN04_08705 [Oscillospiraceae bacterium]|jgi:hypothetical protein|nr:hypothetical protein [Oscillospiraceae bacterium]
MLMTEWSTEVAIRVNREEAFEEGEAKKQREIALKLLRRGLPIEHVIENTGLSFVEIHSMKAQMAQ